MSESTAAIAYRLDVRLSILGADLDYLEIDRLLGVKAKHFARKDQSLEGRPVARQNVWTFKSDRPRENAHLNDMWVEISSIINANTKLLQNFSKEARIKVAVVVHAYSDTPNLTFSPEMLLQVYLVGASLDIDITASLSGEVF